MKSALQLRLNWWNTWRERSVNRRIFSAMLTVGGVTLVVKLAAAAKEIVVAYQFGTSDELDAFLIAFLLPQFAINLIAGSFNAALIPTYIQVREQEGQREAQRLLSGIMILSVGFLVALSVVLAITASYVLPLVASGFAAEKLAVAQSLYYGLLVTLVLSGLATTWGAVLNAENSFALPAVVPVGTSIVTVLVVIVTAQYWGGSALVVGTVGGALVEVGLMGWALAREGISLIPRWCGTSPAVKQVLGQYAPMIAAAFLMGGMGVVSQSMAAMLDPGSVSALAYGSKLTNLLLGIGATSVSTAVLPHFSRLVAVADWAGLRRTIATYTRLLLIITIPITAVLVYFSEPVVAMLFQRGAFTGVDTRTVAPVQAMYLLQVPVYIVGMLFVRLVTALKANHVMMWINILNLSLFLVLTYVLIQWWGVGGIALATSIIYLVNTCVLSWMVLKIMNRALPGSSSRLTSDYTH